MSSTLPIMVPRLGWSMTEGTLVEWLVQDGDRVAAGTPIFVLETDKVENEIFAPAAGTIRLLADTGNTYEVGALLAQIEP